MAVPGINKANKSTKGVQINQEYFSGAQASVFIGDVWVDDIVNIDYTLQHSRTPFYGYGSQYFDFVPKGNILVTGSFIVNFREPNYLWLILERYKRLNLTGEERTKKEADLAAANKAETFEGDKRLRYENFFESLNPNKAQASLIEQAREFNGKPEETTIENFNHRTFDIIIGYGSGEVLNRDRIGETISSVQIMGKGKVVNSDGRPIAEQYNFIARRVF